MTEAIFAGEEIEEFALMEEWSGLALSFTEIPSFSEYFLVGHSPADARDRDRHNEQCDELFSRTAHDDRSR